MFPMVQHTHTHTHTHTHSLSSNCKNQSSKGETTLTIQWFELWTKKFRDSTKTAATEKVHNAKCSYYSTKMAEKLEHQATF